MPAFSVYEIDPRLTRKVPPKINDRRRPDRSLILQMRRSKESDPTTSIADASTSISDPTKSINNKWKNNAAYSKNNGA